MSHLCDITEKSIPDSTMTLEVRVYEDGYIQVNLIDEAGWEVASQDGNSTDELSLATISRIEDELLDQYVYN